MLESECMCLTTQFTELSNSYLSKHEIGRYVLYVYVKYKNLTFVLRKTRDLKKENTNKPSKFNIYCCF